MAEKQGRTALPATPRRPSNVANEGSGISPGLPLDSEDAMEHPHSPESVVVGIDGSEAAINAAGWAVAEAVSRDVALRLVHVVHDGQQPASVERVDLDTEYAETALRAADSVLHAVGKRAKVETAIVHGSPDRALINESRSAAMICAGSVGIGRFARKALGSTAAALACKAGCPVAIIRTGRDAAAPDDGWVAVVVNDSPDNDTVLGHGFREARLRNASILALGVWRWGLGEIPYDQLERRLGRWVSEYPQVHVRPAAARHGAAEFLARTEEPVQLVVVGEEDATHVARLVGPVTHGFSGHAGCSVLVVRG